MTQVFINEAVPSDCPAGLSQVFIFVVAAPRHDDHRLPEIDHLSLKTKILVFFPAAFTALSPFLVYSFVNHSPSYFFFALDKILPDRSFTVMEKQFLLNAKLTFDISVSFIWLEAV